MTIASIEAQIIAEYGAVRSFVMLHPWASHLMVAFAAGGIGFFWSHI